MLDTNLSVWCFTNMLLQRTHTFELLGSFATWGGIAINEPTHQFFHLTFIFGITKLTYVHVNTKTKEKVQKKISWTRQHHKSKHIKDHHYFSGLSWSVTSLISQILNIDDPYFTL